MSNFSRKTVCQKLFLPLHIGQQINVTPLTLKNDSTKLILSVL